MTQRVENSKFAESEPSSLFRSQCNIPCPAAPAVPSTLPADLVERHAHVPTQIDESGEAFAIGAGSDGPFQIDDPVVTAPLPQRNAGCDHRDDLPHHIRAQQQQTRIRKPAQSLEPDAKRLRLDAGKRAVLMLSHDVSFGSECCKLVTVFKSCADSGERANVLCHSSRCEQGGAVRRPHEIAAGMSGRCNDS